MREPSRKAHKAFALRFRGVIPVKITIEQRGNPHMDPRSSGPSKASMPPYIPGSSYSLA
ncbi:hypothetical protein DSLASN_47940 [Desulfoluna limicola]|uniref:Uncharacterized protein n=1 Tax=Desulfoluna limicola TaxID=2810562 RepID=A0ABM7PPA6_9BACT|nr:hypothetical protein DSLASN_47940 [Desulfoluna limicola]